MSQEENMTLNKDMEELKVAFNCVLLKPVRKISFLQVYII